MPIIIEEKSYFRCPGLYCDCKHDNIFFDDNDEQFTLYIKGCQNNENVNKKE